MNVFFLVALAHDRANNGSTKYYAQNGNAWEPLLAQRFYDEDEAIKLARERGGWIEAWSEPERNNKSL